MLSSRLFWRVFGVFAGLWLLSAIAFITLISGRLRAIVVEQVRDRLHNSAVILRSEMRDVFEAEPTQPLQRKLADLADQNGTRLTLVAADGRVVGDSEANPADMENHRSREELLAARATGAGVAERSSPTLGIPMMYYALRVGPAEKPIGFVRVAMTMESVNAEVSSVQRLVWGTALTVSLVALAFTYVLMGRIIQPITTLTRAAQGVAEGTLKQTVDVQRRDELGVLATAFNTMSERLVHRVDQLQQKQAELEENGNLLQTMLGAMVEGVVAVDSEHGLLFANRAAEELLNFEMSKLVGRPVWDAVRSPVFQDTVQKVLADGIEQRVEFLLPRTKRVVALVANRLPGEPSAGAVLVLHDVTELRRLETLRRDFVSNVSHELKTPLTAIQAYADTLLDGGLSDQENNRRFVDHIAEQAERLHLLILDLLALARIESDERVFDFQPINIEHAVRTCLAEHTAVAETKNITLCVESFCPNLRIPAEEEGLRTILNNLLSNALNYTPPNGRVTARLQREADRLRLTISDTGIGIAKEHHERIFERFYRADKARSRELGGTGLGLSIVKHLVSVFGGRVWVESQPGKGCTFFVELPVIDETV